MEQQLIRKILQIDGMTCTSCEMRIENTLSYNYLDFDTNKLAKLKPSLMYNSGRVISYTIIGGIVGALGSVVSFSGTAKGIVAILSGVS